MYVFTDIYVQIISVTNNLYHINKETGRERERGNKQKKRRNPSPAVNLKLRQMSTSMSKSVKTADVFFQRTPMQSRPVALCHMEMIGSVPGQAVSSQKLSSLEY